MSDVTAFNNCMSVFWQQHEAELSRFLASRTGDREQAADLLQEVFLRARACADRFCEMENPRAWLYRTARNLLTDEYRAARDVRCWKTRSRCLTPSMRRFQRWRFACLKPCRPYLTRKDG